VDPVEREVVGTEEAGAGREDIMREMSGIENV
jgi:hypothetical protein